MSAVANRRSAAPRGGSRFRPENGRFCDEGLFPVRSLANAVPEESRGHLARAVRGPRGAPRKPVARALEDGGSPMRRLAALLVLSCSLVLVGPTATRAQDATPVASPAAAGAALPPDATVAGAGLEEWSARFYQWLLSFPNPTSPLFAETGERCAVGQHGPVFFLAPLASPAAVEDPGFALPCTVPAGAAIFVPHVAVSCSTVEAPPFFGRDEAELRACAEGLLDPALRLTLEVDGAAVPVEAYRSRTPFFTVALPPDNLLGAPPVVAGVVADGYHVLLAPLPPGRHTVRWTQAAADGSEFGATAYDLTVAEPEVIAPPTDAGPAATPA